MGQPAQQVLEYLLVWIGPASIGEIYGIFMESLTEGRSAARRGTPFHTQRFPHTSAPKRPSSKNPATKVASSGNNSLHERGVHRAEQ